MVCRLRPAGVARTVEETVAAAQELGVPVMVKSQVKIGGRRFQLGERVGP